MISTFHDLHWYFRLTAADRVADSRYNKLYSRLQLVLGRAFCTPPRDGRRVPFTGTAKPDQDHARGSWRDDRLGWRVKSGGSPSSGGGAGIKVCFLCIIYAYTVRIYTYMNIYIYISSKKGSMFYVCICAENMQKSFKHLKGKSYIPTNTRPPPNIWMKQ